jgi:hypothetical protein
MVRCACSSYDSMLHHSIPAGADMPEFEAEQESRLWRWLLGVVVLALVIWAAAELSGTDRPAREQASLPPAIDAPGTALGEAPAEASGEAPDRRVPATSTPGTQLPVTGAGFQSWVRDSAELGERMDGHEYVASGLERLTSSLRWLADRVGDTELEVRASAIQSAAGRLIPGSAAYAGAVRDLFANAARFVAVANARIGADASVEQNVQEALAAAASLDADAPIERQRHRVFSYFDHMGEAIAAAGSRARAIRP